MNDGKNLTVLKGKNCQSSAYLSQKGSPESDSADEIVIFCCPHFPPQKISAVYHKQL